MKAAVTIALSIMLWGSAALASASIGLFALPDCSSCDLAIPPNQGSGTIYISAVGVPNDPSLCGAILGAEFRVDGLPAGWQYSVTPNPTANVSLGDAMAAGANIAWPRPQTGDCILLYTVVVTPIPPGSAATLQVLRHTTPANPSFSCPRLVPDCFEPFGMCVNGGTLRVNSGPCTVGVEQEDWGRIKSLYD